jgi:hypothetical protein
MKTSIVTVTYDKDLEFLKYNLKSIKKFCKGYHDNVVIIDDHENDCIETQRYLDSIQQKYFINREAKQVKRGYVRQQYMKLLSDKYVSQDTDYICHIDADSIFKKEHTPEIFFRENKPMLVKNNYNKLIENLKRAGNATGPYERWRDTTSKFLNFRVEHEFMHRMPLVYPKNLTKQVRDYLEKIHKSSLLDLVKNLPIMSEYNILGAYAHEFTHEDFFWICRWENVEILRETNYEKLGIFGHYSSREFQQPARYVDLSVDNNELDKILNEGKEND